MRKVTYTFDIYTLEELTGPNKRAALDAMGRDMTEQWNEFTSNEVLQTMNAIAHHFGMKLEKWCFGLFNGRNGNTFKIDTGGFDEDEVDSLIEWIERNLEEGVNGSCPFTGVGFDCLFFDYFKKAGIERDTLKRDIIRAIAYVMEKAVENGENEVLSDTSIMEYASNMMFEFHKDGRIYQGEYDNDGYQDSFVCPTCKHTVSDDEVLHDKHTDQNYCRNCFDPKNPDNGLLLTVFDYLK
jgi:hypothetical protein